MQKLVIFILASFVVALALARPGEHKNPFPKPEDRQQRENKWKVKVENAGRHGTDVGVEAQKNIYKDKNSEVDVGAKYEQHFGGPGGKSNPVIGGYIGGSWGD